MLIISNIQNKYDSLVARMRAAGESVFSEQDDNAAIRRLSEQADSWDLKKSSSRRLECVLIFSESVSLWLAQTYGLPDNIYDKVDVFATTIEDFLAKSLLVISPGIAPVCPPLDRKPISRDCDAVVHLVLFGDTQLTEALALNTALVAHYPNYCRDTRLRTRITIVDDEVFNLRDRLVQRYVHLFNNSYYRSLDLEESNPQLILHRPEYEEVRKDFVDVEWEFVKGSVRNEAVRRKLEEWCVSDKQMLTLAFTHVEGFRNMDEAVSLPQSLFIERTPLLCYSEHSDMFSVLGNVEGYDNVFAFGEDQCDLNLLRMLRKMGQGVNYVYSHCFSLDKDDPVTAPATIDWEKAEALWDKIPSMPKVYSNIFNAMTLGTKMHSLGHTQDDWQAYYALSKAEIDILTEVEHNRWSVEELLLGYRPVNDEEQRAVETDTSLKKVLRDKKKVHYDLRTFDDLREDATGKNVSIYDMALTQGIPLIIKSCITD